MSEKQLPILMACRLSVRYEVNQLKAVPDIPLCSVIVIMCATEAMLYPCFIHVHIFMMYLLSHRTLCSCIHILWVV